MKWTGEYIIDDAGQCRWHEGLRIQDEPMKSAYRKNSLIEFIIETSAATAETSVEQAAAEGLVPILGYLADTINFIVTRHFGFNDIEFVWEQDRTLNALEQAKIDDIYVRAGVLSIDEVRESLGKHPIGVSNAVITTRGVFPLGLKGGTQDSGSPEQVQPDVEPEPMSNSQQLSS